MPYPPEKRTDSAHLYLNISLKLKKLLRHHTEPEQKLPSLRQISEEFNISLSTAQSAYQQLIDEGLVQVRPRSGYFLTPDKRQQSLQPQMPAATPGAERVKVSELVIRMLSLARQKPVINLGTAVPEPELMPLEELAKVQRQISQRTHWAYGGYSPTGGEPALQKALADYLHEKEILCQPEQLLITNGCTEALRIALIECTRPGDIVAIESPTYFTILQQLESLGLKALEIPTSPESGMDLELLSTMMSAIRVNACVVNPVGHNPLGFIMSDQKKRQLIALCHSHGTRLIEDVIYMDMAYDSQKVLPLKALDQHHVVSQCGSFSKSLSPALRVGWLIPAGTPAPATSSKFLTNVSVSTPCQLSVARMLEKGLYQKSVRKNTRLHAGRVLQTREWILQRFPEGTRVSLPQAGFMLWVELPEPWKAMPIHQKALEKGVLFLPGDVFSPTSDLYSRYLRINCCACKPEEVLEGIKRISRCF
ncbi:aminotransferase-like domain-containing protein [Oceanospirillum sediminis]|uniref:PLP-dependent aminotransferase family protein n=1 Tax=Oceanospirillum sediminis TaxID=2760088 RepID=A0A839IKV9_9GAMM|nr:PLP-dependent aminotransferase family protein [Oceanospirillum sediminis]MBB1486013.1 PLP-dependent aminotransferase family protein [Oceanospirillum sediminis]